MITNSSKYTTQKKIQNASVNCMSAEALKLYENLVGLNRHEQFIKELKESEEWKKPM